MPAPKVSLDPWPLDKPLPAVMTDSDLMRVVQLRPAAFYLHKKRGAFRRLEVSGLKVGGTRYSGELVARLRDGNPLSQFGKKRVVKAAPAKPVYPAHVQ